MMPTRDTGDVMPRRQAEAWALFSPNHWLLVAFLLPVV